MNFLKNIFKAKEEPIKSYNDFWNWFCKNEKDFYKVVKEKGNIEKLFFDKISPKLKELKEGFFFLTGMYNDNTVELIITPEGIIKNIIFTEELIAAAPKLEGWKFTALKPAANIPDFCINMGGYEFSKDSLSFYSNDRNGYPDEIDITFVHRDFNEENKNTIINGTYIFLDNYLGEEDFVITIDNVTVIGKQDAKLELIPIGKLKDFLTWRQKEFVEKYEGIKHNTENDKFTMFEAKLKNGNPLLAVINKDLLDWDGKASHPWVLNVEIKYNGKNNNGLPDNKTYTLLNDIEDAIVARLKDVDGYLNIGRQTADNLKEIYFACNDFRKPSKVMHQIQNDYAEQLEITYDIYKDKYWQSFERFNGS